MVLDGNQVIRFAKNRTDEHKGCLEIYTPKGSMSVGNDNESTNSGAEEDDSDEDDDTIGRTLFFDVENGDEEERRSWYIALNNKLTLLNYVNVCSASINDQVLEFFNIIHKQKVFQCKFKQTEDLMAIKEPLKYHENLQTLILKNNPTTLNLNVLCESLSLNRSVTKLDLSNNNLANIEALYPIVQNNKSLMYINLSHNRLDDNAVIGLSKALPNTGSRRLFEIDLSYNKIGNDGIKAFITSLASLQGTIYIQNLLLHRNKISNEGAQIIAENLSKFPELITLDIGRNNISNEGAKALSDAIVQNNKKTNNIKSVNLENNAIGFEGTSELSKLLEKGILDELIFGGNRIGINGLQCLAKTGKHAFPELEIISK